MKTLNNTLITLTLITGLNIASYATCSSQVDMGSHRIVNVADPINNGDVVNKGYLEQEIHPTDAGSYSGTGIYEDIPIVNLFAAGWKICHKDVYSENTASLDDIITTCSQSHLMLACRKTDNPIINVLAADTRSVVTHVVPSDRTGHFNSNGVAWYFNTARSWGFAPAGETINRNICDIASSSNSNRLCWHTRTNLLSSGYRCGSHSGLNGSTSYERLILEHP